MRHRKAKVTLDRKAGPRRALLKHLAISMVIHGRIKTTAAKARAVRPVVERAVTIGKRGDLTARRRLLSTLGSATATERVLSTWSKKFKERPGGYTRIIKLGRRAGDAAAIVLLEFVDAA